MDENSKAESFEGFLLNEIFPILFQLLSMQARLAKFLSVCSVLESPTPPERSEKRLQKGFCDFHFAAMTGPKSDLQDYEERLCELKLSDLRVVFFPLQLKELEKRELKG